MRISDRIPYKVILLFGPTAVGKTELLRNLLPGKMEIISADSMQVYRFMDIGTAKPGPETRKKLPHHLIDILDPTEQYNAGSFVRRTDTLVPEILGRDRIPVLSGGTAFYFKNFIYGLPEAPAVKETVRLSVQEELRRRGADALYKELKRIDPVTYGRLSVQDTYRIARAIEVYRQTGMPLSAYPPPRQLRKDYNFCMIGLNRPREELYQRINRRVDKMFEAGLKEEVGKLLQLGYTRGDPGMKGIGYREFFSMRKIGCTTLCETRELIKRSSRRYAKRQITFFGKLPGVDWFHPGEIDAIQEKIEKWLPR